MTPLEKQLLDRVLNKITVHKGNDGWTPVYVYENYKNKVVAKLFDYIDGQGTRPNTYIGQYVYSGGFTMNRDKATDFKGPQGNKGNMRYPVLYINENMELVAHVDEDSPYNFKLDSQGNLILEL